MGLKVEQVEQTIQLLSEAVEQAKLNGQDEINATTVAQALDNIQNEELEKLIQSKLQGE